MKSRKQALTVSLVITLLFSIHAAKGAPPSRAASSFALEQVLKIRKDAKEKSGNYKKSFREVILDHEHFRVAGEKRKAKKKLGEGFRGDVFELDNGMALKVPHKFEDAFSLEVELLVDQDLKARYKTFGIKTPPVLLSGADGSFIARALIPKESMALEILKDNDKLSEAQLKALKRIFERAKKYALETGIGLDLKASNLYWDGTDWVLFDTGPRTSFVPYGFTLDLPDFKSYLETWTEDEPNEREHELELEDAKLVDGKRPFKNRVTQ